jgi:hypothetical protein
MMVTLDFSKCTTVEEVNKVFVDKKGELACAAALRIQTLED